MLYNIIKRSEGIMMLLKIYATAFLLSALVCVLIDPVWGFYESYMALMASASINGAFITENYHMGMSPMLKLLAPLHFIIPEIPWTAVLLFLCFVVIQTLLLCLMLKQVGVQTFSLSKTIVSWGVLMLVVLGISFIDFSITGVSMLLTCISLLGLWKVHLHFRSKAIVCIAYLVLTGCVFVGYSWRIESGLGGTLIALIFIVITELRFLKLIKAFWFPALIIAFFFIRFYTLMNTHPFFRDVEPMVLYVTDSHNPPPMTETDSTEILIRKMARASFLIDTATFNYDLFKKISDEKLAHEQNMVHTRPNEIVTQIIREAGPTLLHNKLLLIIYGIIIIAIFFVFVKLKKHKELIQLVAFNTGMWSIICFLAYSLKMEQWHFIPILQLTLLGNILFTLSVLPIQLFVEQKNILIIVACIVGGISMSNLYGEIKTGKAKVNEKLAIANEIFAAQNNQVIFFDPSTREVLDDYAFRFYKRRNGVYFYDMAQMPFLPDYEKELNNLCQCNAHSSKQFFVFMKNNADHIIYYSTPYRIDMLESYLRMIQKIEVHFYPVGQSHVLFNQYGHAYVTPYKMIFK